ncbi:MAG: hypothetical protein KJ858_00665, partial [Nanoarchaeota archaeon]|nr:hypothetical protein [Nanoarchaeota archaeon]
MVNVKDILRKHSAKIEEQIESTNVSGVGFSQEYIKFKEEMAPELSRYERWCQSLGNVVKLSVAEKDKERIRRQLEIAHVDIEPWQALTLSVMTFISMFALGLFISIAIALIKGVGKGGLVSGVFANFPFLFLFLIFILSLFLFYFVNGYPARLANKWRLKASSQMVPALLYVVVYMRHTSNLEKAIAFASEHLEYPLALDFKKIFYEVSLGKFSS